MHWRRRIHLSRTRSSCSGASSSCSTRSSRAWWPAPSSWPRSSASSTCTRCEPTYRLALLTALAFLLVAPLPLQLHLGHPERVVRDVSDAAPPVGDGDVRVRLSLVSDGRAGARDLVRLSRATSCWRGRRAAGLKRSALSRADARVGQHQPGSAAGSTSGSATSITVVGIPSAFLLHGYVGFIFGSVKANPWWSTPLMPIVFLFSAIVSGIALVMLLYMALHARAATAARHALPRHRSRGTCSMRSSSTSRSRCST